MTAPVAPRAFTVGTRGSPLALTQTASVITALRALHPGLDVSVQRITTKGDVMRDVPLAAVIRRAEAAPVGAA